MARSRQIFLKVLILIVFTTAFKVDAGDNKRTDADSSGIGNVDKSCNNEGGTTIVLSKACSNMFGSNCLIFGTCTYGVIILENKTHFEMMTFEQHSYGSRPLENNNDLNLMYRMRVSINPFENNGMGTSKPKCKKQLTILDFIVRIFRFENKAHFMIEDKEMNRTHSVPVDSKSSSSLKKSDWEKLCKNEIIKEYQSRINTFDTRYIVFQNKFYFDLDTDRLGINTVPHFLLEDFKDPESYNTTDGRLYLNFQQDLKNTEKQLSSGTKLSSKLFFIIYFSTSLLMFMSFQ